VPAPARASLDGLIVQLGCDAIKTHTSAPQGLHTFLDFRFPIVVPIRLAPPRSNRRYPFRTIRRTSRKMDARSQLAAPTDVTKNEVLRHFFFYGFLQRPPATTLRRLTPQLLHPLRRSPWPFALPSGEVLKPSDCLLDRVELIPEFLQNRWYVHDEPFTSIYTMFRTNPGYSEYARRRKMAILDRRY
jgi:hypothetical protein